MLIATSMKRWMDRGGRPLLRLCLAKAPGARPHIPVDRRAPIAAFAAIAADYPVFLVTRLGSPGP